MTLLIVRTAHLISLFFYPMSRSGPCPCSNSCQGSTTESIMSTAVTDTSSPPSSPGLAPAAASPPPPASSTQGQSQDPQLSRFRRSSSSFPSGKDLFTNLTNQKRCSNDASFATRRASWNEQKPGSGPDTVRFFGNWWDR
jgi:hypothetical protein